MWWTSNNNRGFHRTHQTTISRITHRVTTAIAHLRPNYVRMPNHNELLQEATNFYQIASFPKVIGCIDGTHIRIQSPGGEEGEVFRNRKSYFSINVQVISDSKLKIRDIVASWPGSAHNLTIFNQNRIRTRMEMGQFRDFVLLGDSGYQNRNYVLTPLLNPQTRAEQLYNESHIRTRNCVERQIDVWKRRLPILALGMRYRPEYCGDIAVATAVLHNIAIEENEAVPPLPEELDENHLNYLIVQGNIIGNIQNGDENNRRQIVLNYRQHLINTHFSYLQRV